jgi:hypothetical protein
VAFGPRPDALGLAGALADHRQHRRRRRGRQGADLGRQRRGQPVLRQRRCVLCRLRRWPRCRLQGPHPGPGPLHRGGGSLVQAHPGRHPGLLSGKFALFSGHSGCPIRTHSTGTVQVFWLGWDQRLTQQGIDTARAVDRGPASRGRGGGSGRCPPGSLTRCWAAPPWTGSPGPAATWPLPQRGHRHRRPTGADQLALTWVDGRDGLNNEQVLFTTSTNHGQSRTGVRRVENEIGHPADRGYYSAPAIPPDGRDVYLVDNAFLEPYKQSPIGAANDRPWSEWSLMRRGPPPARGGVRAAAWQPTRGCPGPAGTT